MVGFRSVGAYQGCLGIVCHRRHVPGQGVQDKKSAPTGFYISPFMEWVNIRDYNF